MGIVFGRLGSIEMPKYEVTSRTADYEIRRYTETQVYAEVLLHVVSCPSGSGEDHSDQELRDTQGVFD